MKKLLLSASLLAASSFAQAAEDPTICVFDPVGNSGDVMAIMQDFKINALEWGAKINLRAATDESVIIDELKAGSCDGALLTGIKMRDFNRFTASVEAVGAIPDDRTMRTVLETILSMKGPKAEKYLVNGPYEMAAVMPAGAVYAFMRDKNLYNIDNIQGKKIAVIEGDEVSQTIIRDIGGSPVLGTTTSFAGKFNNGSVDVAFSPAVAYEPLELYRGLGENGGVTEYAFLHLTFQLVINRGKFPPGFAEKARQTALESFDSAFDYIEKARASIDPKYWVSMPEEDINQYEVLLRQSRISLRDKGVYDKTMMKLLRKIRCKGNPSKAECVEKLE